MNFDILATTDRRTRRCMFRTYISNMIQGENKKSITSQNKEKDQIKRRKEIRNWTKCEKLGE
jgi:hypothetical protein